MFNVDVKEVDKKSMEPPSPMMCPEDGTFDVGLDTRTPVALLEYRRERPYKFTGKVNKLTFDLGAAQYTKTDRKRLPASAEGVARATD